MRSKLLFETCYLKWFIDCQKRIYRHTDKNYTNSNLPYSNLNELDEK